MRVFVTGGCGFIGSHVLNELNRQDYETVALRRIGSSPCIDLDVQPEWVDGDLLVPLGEVLSCCDAVLHLAAAGVHALNDWDQCFEVNLHHSLSLWRQAVRFGVQRFVIAGSCFEYGKSALHYDRIPVEAPLMPTGAYHASKASATMAAIALASEHNLVMSILRPFHVYGEGEASLRFWPALKQAAIAGDDFEMTMGEQVRDFTPVKYVAKCFVDELREQLSPGDARIRNVGTGSIVSLAEFAVQQWKQLGATGRLKFGSVPYRENEVMRYVPKV